MTDPSGAGVALASSGAGGREFPLRGMQGGPGKDARGVTAIRQVAGANLAYCFFPAIHNPSPFKKMLDFHLQMNDVVSDIYDMDKYRCE